MIQRLLRAAVCAGLCASLAGCSSTLGQIGAGLAAVTVATVVKAAAESSRDHAHRVAAVAIPPTYPDHEDPDALTCAAKRREFLSVYGGSRRMPPQLRCTEDGDFASARDQAAADAEPVGAPEDGDAR